MVALDISRFYLRLPAGKWLRQAQWFQDPSSYERSYTKNTHNNQQKSKKKLSFRQLLAVAFGLKSAGMGLASERGALSNFAIVWNRCGRCVHRRSSDPRADGKLVQATYIWSWRQTSQRPWACRSTDQDDVQVLGHGPLSLTLRWFAPTRPGTTVGAVALWVYIS